MNKTLKLMLALSLVGGLAVSCKKDEPQTPKTPTPVTPPAPKIAFAQSELSVALGQSVTTTLDNFKGTLAQEGTVEGFEVAIKDNAVTIHAKEYKPGDHKFVFKGNGTSYELKLTLKAAPENKSKEGVFTLDGKPVLETKMVTKRFDPKAGVLVVYFVSGSKSNPRSEYVQFSNIKIEKEHITFDFKSVGIKLQEGGATYLPDTTEKGMKGVLLTAADATTLRFLLTLPNGKVLDVVFDMKKPGA